MSKNGGSVLNVLSFCHPHGDHLGSLLNMLIPDPHPRLPVVECVCVCVRACVCVRVCVCGGGGVLLQISVSSISKHHGYF